MTPSLATGWQENIKEYCQIYVEVIALLVEGLLCTVVNMQGNVIGGGRHRMT